MIFYFIKMNNNDLKSIIINRNRNYDKDAVGRIMMMMMMIMIK